VAGVRRGHPQQEGQIHLRDPGPQDTSKVASVYSAYFLLFPDFAYFAYFLRILRVLAEIRIGRGNCVFFA
jgi:hypothetical protein